MTTCFDVIVVGAGPCALATLSALPANLSVAIITGSEPALPSPSDVHPKVRVVSLESGQHPGVANRIEPTEGKHRTLYATAITGGLANYWGQQFVRYGRGNPYGADLFTNYQAYIDECLTMEALFCLTGGVPFPGPTHLPEGFILHEPRLLNGTADNAAAGLDAMQFAIDQAMKNYTCVARRATRLSRTETGEWSVHLSDGSRVTGRKIWLAAGVIGTAQLVLNSIDTLRGASFRDHAPYMAYASGLRHLLRARPGRHFNAYTLERIESSHCDVFASIYDMGSTELNLVLGSAINLVSPFLRGVRSPSLASMLQPVQIWTMRSFSRIVLDATGTRYSSHLDDASTDDGLCQTIAAVSSLGGKVWRHNRTPGGLGFHYHNLRMTLDDGRDIPVNTLLRRWSDGHVLCSDASILPTIGLRPHTLTAMATARYLVKKQSEQ